MKTQIIEKRNQLKILSNLIKTEMKTNPEILKVNHGLEIMYKKQSSEISKFKTFQQWKNEGKQVKKGEKAFLFWGSPRKGTKQNENTIDEYEFFPLCYLFADTQVK